MKAQSMTDADLKTAILKVDLLLKTKQAFWETPRHLMLLLTAVAAIAGVIGFKLAGQPPQPIIVQFQSPLEVKLLPP